jgi:ankyrin repeat protein
MRLIAIALCLPGFCVAAEPPLDLSEAMRQGLFAEEATRDLKTAEQHYQAIVDAYGTQRKFAASALFRLAEIKRKQGDKAAAAKLYQRVMNEFADDEALAKISGENLTALGIKVPTRKTSVPDVDLEEQEMLRIDLIMKDSPDLMNTSQGAAPPPLMKAASNGWIKVAEKALKHGANINQRHNLGQQLVPGAQSVALTPLHTAIIAGHKTMVEWLIDHGANINDDSDDRTPLYVAMINQRPTIFELLLQKGAKPDVAAPIDGKLAEQLLFSVYGNHYVARQAPLLGLALTMEGEWAAMLLKRKADPNFTVAKSHVIDFALLAPPRGTALLELILKAGAKVQPASEGRNSSLIQACRQRGDAAVARVRLLLAHGSKADVNALSVDGHTPLCIAAIAGDLDLCSLLIEAGADVNQGGSGSSDPPLVTAAHKRHVDLAKLLLKHGADANKSDANRLLPIEHAAGTAHQAHDPSAHGGRTCAVASESNSLAGHSDPRCRHAQ